MKTKNFAHLSYSGMDHRDMTEQGRVDAATNWLCRGCISPRSSVKSFDIDVHDIRSWHPPFAAVGGCLITVVKTDLLRKLKIDELSRSMRFGKVFCSGDLQNEWVTVNSDSRITIRGSKHVSWRRCDVCGQFLYFSMGKQYLYPSPQGDGPFVSATSGLIVTRKVFDNSGLSSSTIRGMSVVYLDVLDMPMDGLTNINSY